MEGVLTALGQASVLTTEQLTAQLNYPRGALDKALKLLEVDGAVQHARAGYSRTANPWRHDAARFEQVTRLRLAELEEIKRYVDHPGCLMEFLSRALDDPAAGPCGRCMNCARQLQRRPVAPVLVQSAVDFLRHDALILEPRNRWPAPVLPELGRALPGVLDHFESGRPKVTIPQSVRAREGRVLCIYGDAGWGSEVSLGKYQTGRFSNDLVAAAAELVQSSWKPQPPPRWVTAIPSQRHAELVRDFAQRLAGRLNLPFAPAVCRRQAAQPQKEMQNSVNQLRNLLGAFRIDASVPLSLGPAGPPAPGLLARLARQVASSFEPPARLPPMPVLLVDDVVDSGWTLTLVSVLLQQAGSGPVYPFALAKASPRGG